MKTSKMSPLTWATLWMLPGLVAAQEPSPPASGWGRPMATESLAAYRGGSDVVNNDMKLMGNTQGNTANNVSSGFNAIGEGAFSNMSGLPLVVQNSGANVLIQNAVILNLQMN